MPTAEGCRERRTRLLNRLDPAPDWVVVADPCHLSYFAGYAPSPFVFRSQGAGAVLLIGRDGRTVLLADNIVQPFAEAAFVDERVCPVWYRGVESAPDRSAALVDRVIEHLRTVAGTRFALERSSVAAGIVEHLRRERAGVEIVDIDPTVHALRRAKDPDEIAVIERTLRSAEAGQAAALKRTEPGMTELDVFALVSAEAARVAGEPLWVYGDFASGPRADQGGGPATDRVIRAGDLFILDFSVVDRLYRCDFSNTFRIGADPTPEQERRRKLCVTAMQAGEALLKPGNAGHEVHRAVRGVFDRENLADKFPHHAGHGIGLGHPEGPFLTSGSTDILAVGDVVTLEPGLYEPGVGGMRFEHNYLITFDGFRRLSRHELRLR